MKWAGCCAGVLGLTAALAGCGSSSTTTSEDTIVSNGTTTIVRNGSTTTHTPPAHTFSAPGMAIHFSYREPLTPASIGAPKHNAGAETKDTRAALGIGNLPDDLIIVTHKPPLRTSVTAANLSQYKSVLDRLFTQALGRRMVSSVTSYGGILALAYPSVPVPGLQTAGTTDRVILLFSGNHEYQLECQATPAHLATIEAACKEMLQTVTIS